MKRILAQATKELNQLWRDRLTVALAIVLPLLTLFIFGFAIRLESKNIPIVIQDLDISSRSRAYIEQIFATNKFQPVPWSLNQPPEEAIDAGKARAVIIIPPDFERQITRGEPVAVQVLIDGTDANNARFVQNSIRATTTAFNQSSGLVRQSPPIEADVRLWFNSGTGGISLHCAGGVWGGVVDLSFPAGGDCHGAGEGARHHHPGLRFGPFGGRTTVGERASLLARGDCRSAGSRRFGSVHLWPPVRWRPDSLHPGDSDFFWRQR